MIKNNPKKGQLALIECKFYSTAWFVQENGGSGSTSKQLSILPFTVKNPLCSDVSCSHASISSKRSSKLVKRKPGRPKRPDVQSIGQRHGMRPCKLGEMDSCLQFLDILVTLYYLHMTVWLNRMVRNVCIWPVQPIRKGK